jgi:hypothetical protein
MVLTATVLSGTVPDDWTAKLVVTWGPLSLAQPPKDCAVDRSQGVAICNISAESERSFSLTVLPLPGAYVDFELKDFSFEDSYAKDNEKFWAPEALLGLPLPPLRIL